MSDGPASAPDPAPCPAPACRRSGRPRTGSRCRRSETDSANSTTLRASGRGVSERRRRAIALEAVQLTAVTVKQRGIPLWSAPTMNSGATVVPSSSQSVPQRSDPGRRSCCRSGNSGSCRDPTRTDCRSRSARRPRRGSCCYEGAGTGGGMPGPVRIVVGARRGYTSRTGSDQPRIRISGRFPEPEADRVPGRRTRQRRWCQERRNAVRTTAVPLEDTVPREHVYRSKVVWS